MSKRANGEGSFYFDEKKQLYRAMIITPAGKRLTKSSKDEEIVKDWLNEQRLLIGRGQHVEPSTITLKEWLYIWVDTYSKPKVRQRSYERNESTIAHTETIWLKLLQKITPTDLQGLYNHLQEEGYAGSTRKKVHQLLHSALKRAMINRYIQTNPADLVDPPKVTQTEVEVFTSDQVELLLRIAQRHQLYPSLLLAFTSGMRLGEILGLRWQDVDLTNGIVHVRQNLQVTSKKGIIFEPPKTEKGKRRITIPGQTVSILKEYRKLWSASSLKFAGKHDLIFVTNKHTPLSPQNFLNRFWKRLQIDSEFAMNGTVAKPCSEHKKLEVILEENRNKKDWIQFPAKNFHVIRHTYATTLLAAGVPIVDVSRALGHAKVSTTLNIYGHAIPENSKLIADKIAGAFLT